MSAKYSKLDEVQSDSCSEVSPPYETDFAEDCSDGSNSEEVILKPSPSLKMRALNMMLQVIILVAAAVGSFMMGKATHSTCGIDEKACLNTAWDEVRQAVKFETIEFNPRFEGPKSPYMGPPTPEVDKLWYDLAALWNFGVDLPTLERMNRSKAAVQFPGLGQYQVGMEAFHQLHCLNYIRMYTYQDHYGKVDYDMMAEGPEERQEHKDHCVETLRQRLMCNPDLNIYTYHWTSRRNISWGNLFTQHRCVNWDHFYSWAEDNAIFSPLLIRPEGAELWS